MNFEDATKYLMKTDNLFSVSKRYINNVEYKVLKNIPKNLIELLTYAENKLSGKTYIVYNDRRITFDDYLNKVNLLSKCLVGRYKISPGDRVAIAMRNCPEYLICLMGIIKAGGVAVLLNAWWTSEELKYGFKDSGALLSFVDPERHSRIKRFKGELNLTEILVSSEYESSRNFKSENFEQLISEKYSFPDFPKLNLKETDEFAIMYSSGSTGHPKGVVLTHIGAMNAIFSWKMFIEISKLTTNGSRSSLDFEPAILCATPLFHVTASHPTFFLSLAIGAKIVLMHKWNPYIALELIKKENVTRFLGVPTMTADMANANKELSLELPSLHYLGSGGAKRPENQVQEQSDIFPKASLASGWGMTETNALGLGVIGEDYLKRPYSTGKLYPPIQELKIIDPLGAEVAKGSAGELCIKSVTNMKGYLNKESETKKILNEGWLRTGDQAKVDEEGFVTIIGRFKEIIIRGGENISCLEVEQVLHAFPDICEACVFPVPDERLGEDVGCLIYLYPKATLMLEDLRKFVAKRLSKFKNPKNFWISLNPLPRGATDKIDKKLILELCVKKGKFTQLN